MNETYLEVTFRRGRPIAAYYYLPRKTGQKSYRTKRIKPGLVIDLSRLGLSRVTRDELAPLLAA